MAVEPWVTIGPQNRGKASGPMKGHVRQRKNGKWECSLPLGYGLDGKKRRMTKSGFETKEEAEQGLIKMAYEVGQHMVVKHSDESLYNYLRYWLDAESDNYEPSWLKNLFGYLENYIGPEIGNVKLSGLNAGYIEKLYKALRNQGKSPQTIKHVHNMLSKALSKAAKQKLIAANPVKDVTPPKVTRSARKRNLNVWTMEELQTFLRIARESRWYIAFLLAAYTGARQGEILAIRWENINFAKNRLTIDSSISRDMKGYKVGDPKTDSSYRDIILPQHVMDELLKHKERKHEKDERLFNRPKDFVVRTWKGTFVSQRNFAREWYRLLDLSGLPKIRFHDLRHTHATLLLESGVNVKAVSARLGHASSKVTLDIYSHVTPQMEDGVAEVLTQLSRTKTLVLEPPAEE